MKLFTVMIAAALAGSFGIAAAADTQPATTGKAAEEAPKVDPEGAILFDKYCASCHPKVDPPRPGEQPKAEDMRELPPDQMKADAPPITMMAAAYRTSAGNDKTRYIGLLTTFLKTPTAETALDQRAVAQFGLKKPISEKYPQITDVELTTIVNWMWDHYALTGPAQSTAQPQVPAAQGQTAQPATAPQAPAATPQQPQAAAPVPAQQTGAAPVAGGQAAPPAAGAAPQQPAPAGGGMQQGMSKGMTQGSKLPAPDSAIAQAEGGKLFKKFCGDCHSKSDSPDASDMPQLPPDQMKIAAPPMSMMAAHYRQVTGGDKNKYITRLVDFTRNPSEDKAVDPRSVNQFGIKKPITDSHPEVTDAELASIAEWMWEYYKDVFIIRLPAHGVWGR